MIRLNQMTFTSTQILFVLLIASSWSSCLSGNTASKNTSMETPMRLPVASFEIVNTFSHDPTAFTQGLVFHDGAIFESDGEYRESRLRKVELATGKTLLKHNLPNEFFGEGATVLGDKIYQLTWNENTCFVYDVNDLKLLKEFKYSGEGWGLTQDGTNLILSDGTHILRVINPVSFETIRTIPVLNEKGKPVMSLNELEFINGEIWANVWHDTRIARIYPKDGKLLGWIDLTRLAKEEVENNPENVLNGIAYDKSNDRIFVTGKNWRKLYEIRLKDQ